MLICCSRTYLGFDLQNTSPRNAARLGVLAYDLFIGGDVNAIDLIVGDVAIDPLNLWTYLIKNFSRRRRHTLKLLRQKSPGVRNLALDQVGRHKSSPNN